MKLDRISRIITIITALQSGDDYDVERLANMLNVCKRTIFRDLKQLDLMGIPYKFNTSTGSYKIDPEYFLQPVDLTLQEALSLLLLMNNASSSLPMPFHKSIVFAGSKIQKIPPQTTKQYCKNILKKVSFKSAAHSPVDHLDSVFTALQNCIRKKRIFEMDYFSLADEGKITTLIAPYHLHFNNRAWYIIGKSSMHNEIRTFKVNRIKRLKPLNVFFSDGENFDPNEYFGRAWSMIPEGTLYNVELLFSPKVAHNVSEVQWHTTQKVRFRPDKSAHVEFRVDGLNEICWWILGYGDQVKVLKPEKLKKKIVDIARSMIENNRDVASDKKEAIKIMSVNKSVSKKEYAGSKNQ